MGRDLPSLPLFFIAFFNSHCFPLSERLEQASVVSLNYKVYDFCERSRLYEAFLEPNWHVLRRRCGNVSTFVRN